MLFDSLVRSSLTWAMAGTRSQTILIETRIGTDNNAPGTPQSHVQKIKGNKDDHRIQGEAASQQDRRNEVRFQQMEHQIPGGRKKRLP